MVPSVPGTEEIIEYSCKRKSNKQQQQNTKQKTRNLLNGSSCLSMSPGYPVLNLTELGVGSSYIL